MARLVQPCLVDVARQIHILILWVVAFSYVARVWKNFFLGSCGAVNVCLQEASLVEAVAGRAGTGRYIFQPAGRPACAIIVWVDIGDACEDVYIYIKITYTYIWKVKNHKKPVYIYIQIIYAHIRFLVFRGNQLGDFHFWDAKFLRLAFTSAETPACV